MWIKQIALRSKRSCGERGCKYTYILFVFRHADSLLGQLLVATTTTTANICPDTKRQPPSLCSIATTSVAGVVCTVSVVSAVVVQVIAHMSSVSRLSSTVVNSVSTGSVVVGDGGGVCGAELGQPAVAVVQVRRRAHLLNMVECAVHIQICQLVKGKTGICVGTCVVSRLTYTPFHTYTTQSTTIICHTIHDTAHSPCSRGRSGVRAARSRRWGTGPPGACSPPLACVDCV